MAEKADEIRNVNSSLGNTLRGDEQPLYIFLHFGTLDI